MDSGARVREVLAAQPLPRGRRGLVVRALMVLWPAFLMAGVTEMLFFVAFDPLELHGFGAALELSRAGIYTLAFLVFWVLISCAAAASVMLMHEPHAPPP